MASNVDFAKIERAIAASRHRAGREPSRVSPSRPSGRPSAIADLPLVAFFRRWQFRIFVGCYVIAVAAGMYFAFRLGAGL